MTAALVLLRERRLEFLSAVSLLFLLDSLLYFNKPTIVGAVSPNVLINEVQVEGGVANDEFVELFNPSDSSVDITGWRLTRKTAGGSESNLAASLSGSVAPQGHFLIAHPLFDGGVDEDFVYSATSSGIAINNTVVLYSDAGVSVVDKVGMGTAGDVETLSVENPDDDGSVSRVNSIDTDNNSQDFEVLLASDPQNSLSSTASPTPTASPSPTASPEPTDSPSPTPTESPTPTASPEPTDTPTPTPTESPELTASPTASPGPTDSPTPEPTESPEPTVGPTPSPTSEPFQVL